MIVEIGHVDTAASIQGDTGHRGEPAGERTEDIHGQGTAPLAQEPILWGKHLDPVIVTVGDEQGTVTGNRHIGGVVETAGKDTHPVRPH